VVLHPNAQCVHNHMHTDVTFLTCSSASAIWYIQFIFYIHNHNIIFAPEVSVDSVVTETTVLHSEYMETFHNARSIQTR